MKQREVTDADSVRWVCVQAFSGVDGAAAQEAVQRSVDSGGMVSIACTPSGGAQSVHITLGVGWEESASDAELTDAIQAERRT